MRRARSCEVYIDGASRGNPGPSGIGFVFLNGKAVPIRRVSRYIGETTNNVAEYLALVYAMNEAIRAGYRSVTVRTDSELLARQVSGIYRVRDKTLRLFYDLVKDASQGFRDFHIEHVPRTENRLADRLARQGSHGRNESTGILKAIG